MKEINFHLRSFIIGIFLISYVLCRTEKSDAQGKNWCIPLFFFLGLSNFLQMSIIKETAIYLKNM